jgi:lipoprotein LpqB-like beta-propeller protein/sporulation and spore germination protein
MRRRLLAVAAAAALLLAGCGIPAQTDVIPVGPGPAEGRSAGDSGPAAVPNTRESATEKGQFINDYLQAAAGETEGALDRVKQFLAPSIRDDFNPTGGAVKVVRQTEKPLVNAGSDSITLTVQTIGSLQENGVLVPASEIRPVKYVLTVGTLTGQAGFFVTQLPDPKLLLLSDTALDVFYERHTIYFWNTENTGLVPDLRYMPKTVPPEQQPNTIVNWLVAGPAPWLSTAVVSLPRGTSVLGNIPAINDGRLQVKLDTQETKADPVQLDRLRRQLLWSLLPLKPRTLEISIRNQDPVTSVDSEYLTSNAAFGLADVPERFVLSNGQIKRVAESPHSADPVPVVKPEANRDIRTAAISNSGEHNFAAVVTGTGATQALRVGVAGAGSVADLKPVTGLTGALGQPAWAITTPGDTDVADGLITANGQVYSFGSAGGRAQPVEWQGTPDPVSSLSIAPDGHRVALVFGGRLYRCVIVTSGDGIGLSSLEQVVPPGVRSVAAVAWSSEDWLVVAGIRPDGRYTIMDVTVDGAVSNMRLEDIGTDAVNYLAAYPSNPKNAEEWAISESYVAHGDAWDVSGSPLKISAKDLYGAKAGDPKNNDPRNNPTAPFFLN